MEGTQRDEASSYNKHSQTQYNASVESLALLPTDYAGSVITIADYGSCEGRNSIQLISQFLSRLSTIDTAVVLLNDTPLNDFGVLSKTITDLSAELSQAGRLRTFVSMVPRSFLEQVTFDGSVDVGICTSALHWLHPGSHGVGHQYLPPLPDAQRAAHSNLVSFLEARSHEIKPGGSLVLGIPGASDNVSLVPIFKCMAHTIQELQDSGAISPATAAEIQGPVHFRTTEELLSSVVAAGGWSVEQQLCKDIPMAVDAEFRAQWPDASSAPEKDYQDYVQKVSGFLTASAANTIYAAAAKSGAGDAASIVEKLSNRFCENFREFGKDVRLGSQYIYVRLQRL